MSSVYRRIILIEDLDRNMGYHEKFPQTNWKYNSRNIHNITIDLTVS